MTVRIPHKNEVIEGTAAVEAYAGNHKDQASSHFSVFLKEFDKLNIDGRFLEIGSGPGFLTALIAQKKPNASITAIEPSSEMISFAKNHLKEKGLDQNVRFIQGSVDDSKLMKSLGQFDLVYTTFSLHHWENPNTAWRYLFNCVAKNGTLLVHDLKRVPWIYYLPFKNGLFDSVRAAYNPDEIDFMLKNMGVGQYQLKTHFPYFWMSIIVNKKAA